MIIGFDFQDTISAHPKVFRNLATALMPFGHTVYIISAVKKQNVSKRIEEVKRSKVPHAHLELVVYDDYLSIPQKKLEACKRLGVKLMIDNNGDVCQLLARHKITVFKVIE